MRKRSAGPRGRRYGNQRHRCCGGHDVTLVTSQIRSVADGCHTPLSVSERVCSSAAEHSGEIHLVHLTRLVILYLY